MSTTERMPSKLLTAEKLSKSPEQTLQDMAGEMMRQAAAAREAGDTETAARLLRAAANLMSEPDDDTPLAPRNPRTNRPDGRRQTTPETEIIKKMLRERWCEAHELQEATGLNQGHAPPYAFAHLLRSSASGGKRQELPRAPRIRMQPCLRSALPIASPGSPSPAASPPGKYGAGPPPPPCRPRRRPGSPRRRGSRRTTPQAATCSAASARAGPRS
jgi:hypothetical protein